MSRGLAQCSDGHAFVRVLAHYKSLLGEEKQQLLPEAAL